MQKVDAMKCDFSLRVTIIVVLFTAGFAAAGNADPLKPVRKADGRKWRIGYLEGGPYENYQATLRAFITRLAETGWIEIPAFPQVNDNAETRTLWNWLSADIKSDFLEFPADAHWTGEWNGKQRKQNKKNAIERLNAAKDIDLMMAFGTYAGLDLANSLHQVPTMLFSTSDPVRSGIVKSAAESGHAHFHACVDPEKYQRQIRLFHTVAGFKRLGIAFQDTPAGRTYAALDDVRKVAGELNFEVVECAYPIQKAYSEEERKRLLACHRSVAEKCDAFYLTIQTGVTLETLPELLAPFFEHRIPTFSQGRTFEVRHGVLMSLAQQNFRSVAKFHARIFSRILHGENPGGLPQLFEDKQEIAINLETAKKIGFNFPLDILAGAKEIHEHIAKPESKSP